MSILATLDALHDVLQAAVPTITVYAPERAVSLEEVYPVVQIYPWKLHFERTNSGMWGNAMWNQTHAHGPDLWRCALLQQPVTPGVDEVLIKRALLGHVATIRTALAQASSLPDASGASQALDIGDHIMAEFDGQGCFIAWHSRAYFGAYLTFEVQQLRVPLPIGG